MVGTGPGDMREQVRFSTQSPEITLRETLDFFRSAAVRHGRIEAIGIASFGPIDLHVDSPTYGCIT